jgi:hypothetical protein
MKLAEVFADAFIAYWPSIPKRIRAGMRRDLVLSYGELEKVTAQRCAEIVSSTDGLLQRALANEIEAEFKL